MTWEAGPDLDPVLAAVVVALRADPGAAVPQRVEDEIVAAFRVRHATSALRDDAALVPPPQLVSTLVTAFRQHQVPGNAADPSSRGLPWYLVRAAVLVAAVCGAVWMGIETRTLPHVESAPPPAAAVAAPRPDLTRPATAVRRARSRSSETAARAARDETPPQPVAGRAVATTSVLAAAAPLIQSGTEVGADAAETGFVPLSYGALLPGEPALVVRVEVPQSALLDFGAPADVVPGDTAAVRADVLLSEDGMPRGIRFVDRFAAPATRTTPAATRTREPSPRR